MLEHASYCPILLTRVAEIKALSQLPAAVKNVIFPILVARPWPNAKELDRTWEKIADAFGERRFGLDLDQTRRTPDTAKVASSDFARLFLPENGFKNYYDLISSIQNSIPVFRFDSADPQVISDQIDNVREIDRGLILRISQFAGNYGAALPLLLESEIDLIVIIDVGWGRDILTREAWASGLVNAVNDQRPDSEIVIAGSSFPESFASIADRAQIEARERTLFGNITRQFNMVALKYGDWGSTRPPTPPIPMRNIPRIDLPLTREWICFRQIGDEDYADIAARTISDPAWPTDLKIWGTYAIEAAAEGLPGSIRSPASAAAARINIHLYRQATFGQAMDVGDTDEPYTDD